MNKCVWHYTGYATNKHYAIPSCRTHVENYLSKIRGCIPSADVANWYNGKLCPICGKEIQVDYKYWTERIQPQLKQ